MKRIFHLQKDTRRRLVWLVTAMLLWQQVTVAAFACVVPLPIADSMSQPHPVAMLMMGDGCEQMLEVQAAPLCSKHCQPDHATQAEARTFSVPMSVLTALPPTPLSIVAITPPSNRTQARLDRLLAGPSTPRLVFCSLLI